MKILGFAADGAIVQMSGKELARILGHDSVGWGPLNSRVSVNVEYDVNARWDWTKKAITAYEKIKASTGMLRAAADILDQAPPPVLREDEKPND
jgi:hypothetical protein